MKHEKPTHSLFFTENRLLQHDQENESSNACSLAVVGSDIFAQSQQGIAEGAFKFMSKDDFEQAIVSHDDFEFKLHGDTDIFFEKVCGQLKASIMVQFGLDSEKIMMQHEIKNIYSGNMVTSDLRELEDKEHLIGELWNLSGTINAVFESKYKSKSKSEDDPAEQSKAREDESHEYCRDREQYKKLYPAMIQAIKKEVVGRGVFVGQKDKIEQLPQYISFAVIVDHDGNYVCHGINDDTRAQNSGDGKPKCFSHAERNALKKHHHCREQNSEHSRKWKGSAGSIKRKPGVIIFRLKGLKQPILDAFKKSEKDKVEIDENIIDECIQRMAINDGCPCEQCAIQIHQHFNESYHEGRSVNIYNVTSSCEGPPFVWAFRSDKHNKQGLVPSNGTRYLQGSK